jgi:drug/metabolite transporter (DMT)-like permease
MARARGALLGLGAAALFGASTPLAKRLVGEVPPPFLAGLLYGGAAIVLSVAMLGRPTQREARLRRSDLPTLGAITFFGGVAAPVLLLVGLGRVSGVAGSLLLNLEAVFTLALALAVFGEHLDRRAALGAGAVVVAAAVLGLGDGRSSIDLVGVAAIAGACACWAVDNNLTQRLSGRDPFALVRAKAAVAGTVNLTLAALIGTARPTATVLLAAVALGGAAYGLSVVLDAYALRAVGAAREAAYFGTAPVFGVLTALVVLGERVTGPEVAAIVVMGVGVALLVTESHGHRHEHEPIHHDHRHRHDDGHHDHRHADDGAPPLVHGEHTHPHEHEPLVHAHAHVSDAHHRHVH